VVDQAVRNTVQVELLIFVHPRRFNDVPRVALELGTGDAQGRVQFAGRGRWRQKDRGVWIDASGGGC
jgi:hypothetical protein